MVEGVLSVVDEADQKDFIVGYRFSPEEYEEPGIRMADTLYLVEQLAEKSLDYLHISLADYKRVSVSEDYQKKTIMQYVHEQIAGRVPLIGVGDIRTKQDLEESLAHSEIAAVGRALIIDPHWVSKVIEGNEDALRTVLANQDRQELMIGNGMLEFLKFMMPDRLR